jgi:hypothetical protein
LGFPATPLHSGQQQLGPAYAQSAAETANAAEAVAAAAEAEEQAKAAAAAKAAEEAAAKAAKEKEQAEAAAAEEAENKKKRMLAPKDMLSVQMHVSKSENPNDHGTLRCVAVAAHPQGPLPLLVIIWQ